MMSGDDLVDLVFVTTHNFLYCPPIKRQEASDVIRSWFTWRESVRHRIKGWRRIYQWLTKGTFANNIYNTGAPEPNWAQCSIGWEHVIGMYIKERLPDIASAQHQKTLEAQERLFKKMESQMDKGEEWRSDNQ